MKKNQKSAQLFNLEGDKEIKGNFMNPLLAGLLVGTAVLVYSSCGPNNNTDGGGPVDGDADADGDNDLDADADYDGDADADYDGDADRTADNRCLGFGTRARVLADLPSGCVPRDIDVDDGDAYVLCDYEAPSRSDEILRCPIQEDGSECRSIIDLGEGQFNLSSGEQSLPEVTRFPTSMTIFNQGAVEGAMVLVNYNTEGEISLERDGVPHLYRDQMAVYELPDEGSADRLASHPVVTPAINSGSSPIPVLLRQPRSAMFFGENFFVSFRNWNGDQFQRGMIRAYAMETMGEPERLTGEFDPNGDITGTELGILTGGVNPTGLGRAETLLVVQNSSSVNPSELLEVAEGIRFPSLALFTINATSETALGVESGDVIQLPSGELLSQDQIPISQDGSFALAGMRVFDSGDNPIIYQVFLDDDEEFASFEVPVVEAGADLTSIGLSEIRADASRVMVSTSDGYVHAFWADTREQAGERVFVGENPNLSDLTSDGRTFIIGAQRSCRDGEVVGSPALVAVDVDGFVEPEEDSDAGVDAGPDAG